jgi:fatty acid/phospholipid biosynthesis enzyme
MSNYPNKPTDRIDTTVTEVAVQRGDTTSTVAAAAAYVKRHHAEERPKVLAIWPAHERDTRGNPVFNVEWEPGEGT